MGSSFTPTIKQRGLGGFTIACLLIIITYLRVLHPKSNPNPLFSPQFENPVLEILTWRVHSVKQCQVRDLCWIK